MGKKGFLKAVLTIAAPVGLQSMLQSSFGMIDQMMVGQLGSKAVAAVEAAGRPGFMYSMAAGAVASVAGIMISQYLGMEDEEMVAKSLWVSLGAAVVLGALFALPCILFPGKIVGIYLAEDLEILDAGRDYLGRIAWTYLPMGVSSVLSVLIRCVDGALWPLYAGISAAVVNTILNDLLIFGRLGLPALGVTGAAIASQVSQTVNLVLILAMVCQIKADRPEAFRLSLDLGPGGFRGYLRMLVPVLLGELCWSLGQNVNTVIYGHLEPGDLAAMSITGPVQGLFIGALQGVSQAAGILIGKRLGAGECQEAYREAKKLMGYGLCASLVLSALLIWLRNPYVLLYPVGESVQGKASELLMMFAILAPVKVANMILGGGIIKSGGKTKYAMAIDLAGTWLAGIPLGLWAAFALHLPVKWVYFILSQEEILRLVLAFRVFKGKRWIGSLKGTG